MIFSMTNVVLSAEEYTIQTISAKKEASITPAFEKKVQKSTLHSEQKKEGSCNVVTVGKYTSVKAAHHDLKKAKAISKDAFVRPINRTTPKVCESKTATPKATVEAKTSIAPSSVKKDEAVAAVHEATKPVAVVSTAPVTNSAVVQEVKSEPCKIQPCENVSSSLYVYDRNLARKSDIHEAIEYYKNSPYHTFKPVISQR